MQDFSQSTVSLPGISALRLGKGVRVLRVFRLIRVLKGGGILQDESDSLVVDVGVAFGGGKAHFLRSHGIHGTGLVIYIYVMKIQVNVGKRRID